MATLSVTGTLSGYSELQAYYSDCTRFRWLLRRAWKPAARPLGFMLLNPATANGANDQALECITRKAQRWGFGALEVVSLYALVAADPLVLARAPTGYVIGAENHETILKFLRLCPDIVLCWGNGPGELLRARWHAEHVRSVLHLTETNGNRLYALETTRAGMPRHPFYMNDASIPYRVTANPKGLGVVTCPGYNVFHDVEAATA